MSTVAPLPALRSEPAFVRWATAEGVSILGTSVTTVVLPIVVYEATGSAMQTGVLFALRVVPYLVFGLVAGPLADRGNRRRLIIGGNVVEGALVATIPIAHLLDVLTVGHVYVVAFLSATAFVFSDAAVFGAVPAMVGPARLAAANGFLSSLASGAEIVGPVVAGVLVASIGATNAIWIDSASFLAAAAVQRSIRSDFRDPQRPADRTVTARATIGRAMRFIRDHRTIAVLLVTGFANSFAFGAVLGLLVPYAVEVLGIDSDDGRIGVLYGGLGVGSLVTGLVFARVFRRERVRILTPGSMLLSTLLVAVLALAEQWVVALVALAAFSFSIGITIMVGITYRQLVAPDELRSSVNVIGRMVAWGGQPFGAAIGGLVAAATSVTAAYTMACLVMAVGSAGATLGLQRVPTTVASIS